MLFLFSPLEQFSIIQHIVFFIQMKILGFSLFFDISVTIFLLENLNNFLIFFFLMMVYLILIKYNFLKTNTFFLKLYLFLYTVIQQQLKNKQYLNKYFIFISTIFLFIIINNLFGMIPYSFVSTAQLGQNFFLSSGLIIYLTILGFYFLKDSFFNIFIPTAPKAMLPFLIIIEVISYLARAFSLSIRLFANLMSGHTLLFILCAFNSIILTSNFFGFLIASLIILLIFGLEFVIAFMQAYVFTVLVSVYLKDSATSIHH